MTSVAAAGVEDAPAVVARSARKAELGWAMFEFARAPTYTLIFMFVFAPYFVQTVVGDPVRGQELWGLTNTLTGATIAVLAPLIGAVADRMGNRKPWIIAAALVISLGAATLWFARPGGAGVLGIAGVMAIVVMVGMAFELGTLMHNAMLPTVAAPARVGRLSGLGLGLGNVASFTVMVSVLTLVALPASRDVAWSFLPDRPILGIDPSRFEHARVVGPLAAGWMLLFLLPFLLWAPDVRSTGVGIGRAISEGVAQLKLTLQRARLVANVGRFLVARMLYNDAIVAMQAYCAVYAAGVFGWDAAAILIFAVLMTGCCFAGSLLGGWIDTRLGSRRTIIVFNLALGGALVAVVSMGPDRLFFLPFDGSAYGPVWSLPYFATLPELLFLIIFLLLAVIATMVIVSSRAMLARIAPLSMMAQFFGLFSLSGFATAFVGHGLVTFATAAFDSQRAGLLSVLSLLLLGAILMIWVREERSTEIS